MGMLIKRNIWFKIVWVLVIFFFAQSSLPLFGEGLNGVHLKKRRSRFSLPLSNHAAAHMDLVALGDITFQPDSPDTQQSKKLLQRDNRVSPLPPSYSESDPKTFQKLEIPDYSPPLFILHRTLRI